MPELELSVVVGSYNRKAFLLAAIKSVLNEKPDFDYEIIVIDGGSTDGSMEWLLKQKDIITIVQHNRGTINGKPIKRRSWGYFMNLGFKAAQGKFILMLSDDCLVIPGAIKNGIGHFQSLLSAGRNIGAMAFYWRNWPEQKEYNVGITFGKVFVNHGLYLRSALEAVSWINEDDYNFYHADGDLCLKLWDAGYDVVDAPDSYVEHFTHANMTVRASNIQKQQIDHATYLEKWQNVLLPGNKVSDDWISKNFIDPFDTTKNFPVGERLVINLKYGKTVFSKIFKKLLYK